LSESKAWLALVVLLGACGGAKRSADARPNVALIMVDTLRADRLSCYGYPADVSPELDALAAEGLRFERVISQSSWTRPSIGSLLTSRYPRSLGLYKEERELLADGFWTLAEALQHAGYCTLGATANPHLNRSFNFAQGFDDYADSKIPFSWMEQSEEQRAFQEGREIFTWLLQRARVHGEQSAQPIYVQALIMEVHENLEDRRRPARFRGLFEGHADPTYLESVRHSSFLVAGFIERLRALKGWENSLFVVTSDHGHGLSDHPSIEHYSPATEDIARRHGWLLYESTVRVPLIMLHTQQALPKGLVVRQQVGLLDLMPTILDLTGSHAGSMAGKSLRPLWERPQEAAASWPRYQVSETRFRGSNTLALYTSDWDYFSYRRPIPMVAPLELQVAGEPMDGLRTNQLDEHLALGESLGSVLSEWEAAHPSAAPTLDLRPLPLDEAEQLKAIGYQ